MQRNDGCVTPVKEDAFKASPSNNFPALAPLLDRTEMLLSFGGDDRLTVDAKLMNKYLSSTKPRPNVLRRGSCTCSTITVEVRLPDVSFDVQCSSQHILVIPDGEIFLFE